MQRSLGSIAGQLLLVFACTTGFTAATVGLAGQASGTIVEPVARAARRVSLVENAHLKLVSEHGATLTERGRATGTYNAPVTTILTIHPKSVTAVVTIYPSGGSITGVANANYVVKGSKGYFGGTFTLRHGTGKFRHISEINGKPLGISGIIDHYSFAMEVKAHGEANL